VQGRLLLATKLGVILMFSNCPFSGPSQTKYLPQRYSPSRLPTMATMLLQKALRSAASKAVTTASSSQLRSVSTLGLLRPLTASLSRNRNNQNNNIHQRTMATVNAGSALSRLAADHPHMEIVRYQHKNVKWTLKHVDYYSDALACGFLDAGLQPGDVVLSWLPEHFAEQVSSFVCLLFALYDDAPSLCCIRTLYYHFN
jgi:hypothetical protein